MLCSGACGERVPNGPFRFGSRQLRRRRASARPGSKCVPQLPLACRRGAPLSCRSEQPTSTQTKVVRMLTMRCERGNPTSPQTVDPNSWLEDLHPPSRWDVSVAEHHSLMSVTVVDDGCTGTLVYDVRSRERLIDIAGAGWSRSAVVAFLHDIAARRDQDGEPTAPTPPVFPFGPWSTLQELAITAGGIWFPSPHPGQGSRYGQVYRFRRVNTAIRRRRDDL